MLKIGETSVTTPLFDKRSYPDADAAMHSCGGARSPEKGELMI